MFVVVHGYFDWMSNAADRCQLPRIEFAAASRSGYPVASIHITRER